MQKKHSNDAAFYIVYIREAHPTDGWQVGANRKEKVLFEQPKTIQARANVAKAMCTELKVTIPCLIDGLDNKVGVAYSAWPDRMYVVGVDGKIVFMSRPGPFGFRPGEVQAALDEYLTTLRASKGK